MSVGLHTPISALPSNKQVQSQAIKVMGFFPLTSVSSGFHRKSLETGVLASVFFQCNDTQPGLNYTLYLDHTKDT